MYEAIHLFGCCDWANIPSAFDGVLAHVQSRLTRGGKLSGRLFASGDKPGREMRLTVRSLEKASDAIRSKYGKVGLESTGELGDETIDVGLFMARYTADVAVLLPDRGFVCGATHELTLALRTDERGATLDPAGALTHFDAALGSIGYFEQNTEWEMVARAPGIPGELVSNMMERRAWAILNLYIRERRRIPSVVFQSDAVLLSCDHAARLPEPVLNRCTRSERGSVYLPAGIIDDDVRERLDTSWTEEHLRLQREEQAMARRASQK